MQELWSLHTIPHISIMGRKNSWLQILKRKEKLQLHLSLGHPKRELLLRLVEYSFSRIKLVLTKLLYKFITLTVFLSSYKLNYVPKYIMFQANKMFCSLVNFTFSTRSSYGDALSWLKQFVVHNHTMNLFLKYHIEAFSANLNTQQNFSYTWPAKRAHLQKTTINLDQWFIYWFISSTFLL